MVCRRALSYSRTSRRSLQRTPQSRTSISVFAFDLTKSQPSPTRSSTATGALSITSSQKAGLGRDRKVRHRGVPHTARATSASLAARYTLRSLVQYSDTPAAIGSSTLAQCPSGVIQLRPDVREISANSVRSTRPRRPEARIAELSAVHLSPRHTWLD